LEISSERKRDAMKMDEFLAKEQEYQEMLTRWDMEDKAREDRMKELDELDQLTAKAKAMREQMQIIPGRWSGIWAKYMEEEKPAQWIAILQSGEIQLRLGLVDREYNQKYEQMKQELKKKRGLNHIFQQKDWMGYTRAIMAMENEITYLLTQQLTGQA
jgi:hypothetical protein